MTYFRCIAFLITLSLMRVSFGVEESQKKESNELDILISCIQQSTADQERQLIYHYLLRPDRWQRVIRSSRDLVTLSQACKDRESSTRLVEYFIYLCILPISQFDMKKIVATPEDVQLMCEEFSDPTHVTLLREQCCSLHDH